MKQSDFKYSVRWINSISLRSAEVTIVGDEGDIAGAILARVFVTYNDSLWETQWAHAFDIISDEQAAQWATNEAKIDREWLLNVRTTFLAS